MQGITLKPGGEVRLVDAFFSFVFGQDLYNGFTAVMRDVHDLDRIGQQEHKDAPQHVHHKIHWRDIIVMDDDAEHRLVGGFLLPVFGDFDFWGGPCFHLLG